MTTSGWDDDERLLAELDAALRARAAVPDELVQTGKEMFGWRLIDAELAALTFDSTSAEGSRTLATVRGQAPPRALSFHSDRLNIEVEISGDGLRGQIIPPRRATVEVDDGTDPRPRVRCDSDGWFSLPPTAGRFRMTVRADGFAVRTEWIRDGTGSPATE